MIAFHAEKPETFFKEAEKYFEAHNKEINLYNTPLIIDEDAYEADTMLCVTARDGGSLVGYITFDIHGMLHTDELHASMTTIYVIPDYRDKGIGKALLDFSEKMLKLTPTKMVHIGVPVKNDFSAMLQGYEKLETVYVKRIKDE